jgi:Protein of unknown function (DUF3239)
MPGENRSYLMGDDTVASNPGELKANLAVFYRCFPRPPLIMAASLLFPVGVAIAANCLPGGSAISAHAELIFPPLIFVAIATQVTTHPARYVREYFEFGDLNPGIVVSHDPDLIAVHADLTKGFAPCPMIKIRPHPLKRMTGGRPPVGTRLATIAGYQGSKRKDRWEDVHPVAVNCATADPDQIKRALSRIGEREWRALDEGLRQIPEPYRPGLYPVTPPDLAPEL